MTTPPSSTGSSGPGSADDVRLREALGGLPAYIPGKPAPTREGLTAYKVSSNENPYPPLPERPQGRRAGGARGQPVPRHGGHRADRGDRRRRRRRAVAHRDRDRQRRRARPDHPGDLRRGRRGRVRVAVVRGVPDRHGARRGDVGAGRRSTPSARHRLDAMLAAVTERTKVVIVCSPNNPTGPAVRERELRLFLDRVPSSVLVGLDEAYVEFVTDPEAPDAIQLRREHPNLVVLRTFSKAYGLAGLRVGYAMAHDRIAARRCARRRSRSGSTRSPRRPRSRRCGTRRSSRQRVDALVEERARMAARWRTRAGSCRTSQANFLWFPLGAGLDRLRGGVPRGGADGRPVRRRRGPGHHRRDRGQRPPPRGSPGVRPPLTSRRSSRRAGAPGATSRTCARGQASVAATRRAGGSRGRSSKSRQTTRTTS